MSHPEITGQFVELFNDYYREAAAELAQGYPNDQRSLEIEARDVYQKNPDLLDDYRNHPQQIRESAEEAIGKVDLPIETPDGAHVRLTDTHGVLERHGVGELYADLQTQLVAVEGRIERITSVEPRLVVAAFDCQRCGTTTRLPQPERDFNEPHECENCERQGPFKINIQQSETVDQRQILLKQPPDEQSGASGEEITVVVEDDLIHAGGARGLPDKTGEVATIIGKFRADTSNLGGRGVEVPTYDTYLQAHSFVFGDDTNEEIDVSEHMEQVRDFAGRDNAIDLFAESIDPGLTLTDKWEVAVRMATAYLFGAPRIDPDGGEMVRGDLHMLFVSDPGMRKSVFADKVAELSPQAELRQATGMSSDVGLTAVGDDPGRTAVGHASITATARSTSESSLYRSSTQPSCSASTWSIYSGSIRSAGKSSVVTTPSSNWTIAWW